MAKHAAAPGDVSLDDFIDVDPGTSRTGRGAVQRERRFVEPYALDWVFLLGRICRAFGIQVVRSNLHDQSLRLTMFGGRDDIALAQNIVGDVAENIDNMIRHAEIPPGETRQGYIKSWIHGLAVAMGERTVARVGLPKPSTVEENIRAYREKFPRTKRVGSKVKSRAGYEAGYWAGQNVSLPSLGD